jgi:ABC-2 type transport system ATP-binding protein
VNLLYLQNLRRTYGDFVALDADKVELPPGAIGLLGPNGAGKSTLIKVLLGLLPPSSGRAEVLGLDVVKGSMEIRSRVGYMSESESFVSGLKAVELVALAGEVCGMPRRDAHRRAHEVLTYLGVEEVRYRRVDDFSTGTKQRIQLAQALVHDPEVLILDEPTNGLDPVGRRAMLGLIRSLHRDFGKSILLSSHLLDDVDRVCDSIVVLEKGRVLASGRIDVLRAHFRNRYRLRWRGEGGGYLDRLREAGVVLLGEPAPSSGAHEAVVEAPPGFAGKSFLEVLHALEPAPGGQEKPVLVGLVPDEESLSDLFQRLVGSGATPPVEEALRAG